MKDLIIIGGGGMGREVYDLASQCKGNNVDYRIKGFLDDNLNSLSGLNHHYPPVIGTISDYRIEENDVFVCSIGNVQTKKECTEIILNRGGQFISLIHPTALVNCASELGFGCLVFPYAVVGSEAVVGNHVLLQSFSVVGHDVTIGNYSRIDCHAVCTGGAIIEEEITIHTAAIINQKVLVKKGAHVGAGSFVIRKVKENTTVYGNPAIKLK